MCNPNRDDLAVLYYQMVRIRTFEERLAECLEEGGIQTPCHLYTGQEAIAVGVCSTLRQDDTVWGGHRSHGHYLAKGGDMKAMMAEIHCRATGCSGGRGGSMHLFARDVGILGTVPIVAATVPLAVGAGLAAKLRGDTSVAIAFFGDGTMEEGHVHEAMNIASLYKLPVVFVCENNLYASHMHITQRRAEDNLSGAGLLHGMEGIREDGNDVLAVTRAASRAVGQARTGAGPSFIEFRTFRWHGHVGPSTDLDVGVKRKDELKDWIPRDPIARVRALLTEGGYDNEGIAIIDSKARQEVEEAVQYAQMSPFPNAGTLRNNVYVQKGHFHCA